MNRETAKQEILQRIPCTDFLTKSRHGGYCCPFCGSGSGPKGTGAVKYYPQTNTTACFAGCADGLEMGKKRDVLDYIQQQNSCDFNTALHIGANILGISLDVMRPRRTSAAEDFADDTPQTAYRGPQRAGNAADDKKPTDGQTGPQGAAQEPQADYTAYYEHCRARITDPAAASYLQARGISTATAAAYNIGFDPQADPASAPGAMGSEYKAHPCPRLVIPCTPGFYIARSTDSSTPAAFKSPNPKGSSAQLFNAAALYAGKYAVFVVEGVFDALAFIESGLQAVALNSKGNGRLLLKQLQEKPTASKIIIVPDNEKREDGTPDIKKQAQTMRTAQELCKSIQAAGADCIVYNVAGDYHDANDALVQAPDDFRANILDALQEAQRDFLTDFLDKIQTEAYKPYRTELSFFDGLLNGGVIRQTLLLLLAAPGTGKTTLCAQIAECMAVHKKPVVYFNLEMSREQMIAKAISSRLARKGTALTALDVMQGYRWTDEQRQAVVAAVEEYRDKVEPYLKYNPDGIGSDIDAIREYLHSVGEAAKAAGQEAPAVVLDYMHLITSRAGIEIQELIKQAVVMLKQYAIDYNTFVIGIVATNRDSNKNGRITMESGRDSSNLEYTADYQLSLNYYEVDNGSVKANDVEGIARLQQEEWRHMIIRVLKGRFCMPGRSARVYFKAASNIFYGEDDFIPADDTRTPFDDPRPAGNGQRVTASF